MKSQVESLLFISPKPMSAKAIHAFLKKDNAKAKIADIEQALADLQTEYNVAGKGVNIIESAGKYQFVTSADNAELIKKYVKDDSTGELTQASLETLAIIAYRAPVSKPVIEQIRGVNCSVILRNLMIRGLIQVDESEVESLYSVTPDFLKHLGLTGTQELPNYERLSTVENLEQFLDKQADEAVEDKK